MSYLLFAAYFLLLCWLLTKIKFIRQAQLGNGIIIVLFFIRILAGLLNGWLNNYYFPISDSLGFHREGIIEYNLLFTDPREYLLNLFINKTSSSYGAIFDVTDSFWNNLRTNIIIKLLSLFNILSGGNYFINVLFYNFLTFFGPVALFRIFIQIFPNKKYTLLLTVFLLPSFIYFTSGIHREGLIFLALSFACYHIFSLLNEGISFKRLLYTFICLLFLFLLRNFVFITLIPALAAWFVAKKKSLVLRTFVAVYGLCVLIFFTLKYVHPVLDLPQYVAARQVAFNEVDKQARSAIPTSTLYAGFRSFLANAPQALNHILMRPYLSESKTLLYLPAAIEILLYECLFLAFLIFSPKKLTWSPFIYFGIFFTLSSCLLIGYTVPIMGAFVRYRSIYFPFLITPLCCAAGLERLKGFIHNIKL